MYSNRQRRNKEQAGAKSTAQLILADRAAGVFVDNRPEAVAQRKLQALANAGSVIQRFVGPDGSNQDGQQIPVTLNPVFVAKHVAATAAQASVTTNARMHDPLDAGGTKILAGNIGNTVATAADWMQAINGALDVVPESFDATNLPETARFHKSEYMLVPGWVVKSNLVPQAKQINCKVGGIYTVTAGLDASLDVDHCTQ